MADLLADDVLRFQDGVLALQSILLDKPLQVIDVEEIHVFQIPDFRIDIARDS